MYYLLCMLLIMASCSGGLNEWSSEKDINNLTRSNRFYGVKSSEVQTRAVGQKTNFWYNGTTITVKFLNDPYNKAKQIETIAKEWEKYANIKFDFVKSSEDAIIRIGFDWNNSRWITWSYTGNDAKSVKNQQEATVNFGSWDVLDDNMQKGDILRAFGQVLGLELEHRHINFDAGFTNRIQTYWEGEIQDIPWVELKKYVIDPLKANNILQTDEYDESSIMVWPFDRRVALNTARDWNLGLSELDKKFIAKVYPKEDPIITIKFNYLGGDPNPNLFNITRSDDLVINWGNGKVITYTPNQLIECPKEFYKGFAVDEAEEKTIEIYGGETSITKIEIIRHRGLHYLDVSKNINLQELVCYTNNISELDVSKNVDLTILNCSVNKLSYLNVEKNTKLIYLNVWQNRLTNLDLSKNSELKRLDCYNNNLSSLDLSKNMNINRIMTGSNPFLLDLISLTSFANSIPNTGGTVLIGGESSDIYDNLTSILGLKGWYVSRYYVN